jgi:hypothetical protein
MAPAQPRPGPLRSGLYEWYLGFGHPNTKRPGHKNAPQHSDMYQSINPRSVRIRVKAVAHLSAEQTSALDDFRARQLTISLCLLARGEAEALGSPCLRSGSRPTRESRWLRGALLLSAYSGGRAPAATLCRGSRLGLRGLLLDRWRGHRAPAVLPGVLGDPLGEQTHATY